jgi:hypothetical protein
LPEKRPVDSGSALLKSGSTVAFVIAAQLSPVDLARSRQSLCWSEIFMIT